MRLKIFILYVLTIMCFSSCESERTDKELILETDNCKYYCISKGGLNNCITIICECGKGFNCDVSNY